MMLARSAQMLGSSFDWLRVPGLCKVLRVEDPGIKRLVQAVAGFCLLLGRAAKPLPWRERSKSL
ncbi:hypothetical protein CORC01_13153 [Colletotrichum orchidophilum]|uniref:Uncharacterized protein n=1 Tax=Colletotrichum orchidophilum TaxID=1209926 RepID=A0A1G4AR28_9PEZI|nr:uncharacterized protein CORC01_13153 [Colletotrichum orchidophilum]OHE91556.1 hypothetical protein CORC01_13153 [Colletotrichum orchidophilum]